MDRPLTVPDFHSHVLPNADHGSDSVETSVKQLTLAYRAGVRQLFATSHFYPHRHTVPLFLERRETAYRKLTEALRAQGVENEVPTIRLGAEVLICPHLDELDGLDRVCVYGTKTLLLEMPFSGITGDDFATVEDLCDAGYDVVLAHADRYKPADIDRLLSYGARIQLNADSLAGLFVPAACKRWIREGKVIALGSDIHGADEKAYDKFRKAVGKLGDRAAFVAEESAKIFASAKEYPL